MTRIGSYGFGPLTQQLGGGIDPFGQQFGQQDPFTMLRNFITAMSQGGGGGGFDAGFGGGGIGGGFGAGGFGPQEVAMLRQIISQLDRSIVERLLNGGLNGAPGGFPQQGLGQQFGGPQLGGPQLGPGGRCGPPPPVCGPRAQPQQPAQLPEIKGTEKGGWLAAHGGYKKEGDCFVLNDGRKVQPIPGQQGKFNVLGPDGRPQGVYNAPGGQNKIASPLTFDLNGDGNVSTTGTNDGRKFDIDGDGRVDQTAWAGKGDGVLAFGEGASGKQLLGNNTDLGDGKRYANGFDALKGLAQKHLGAQAVADNKLDANELAQLEQKANLHMVVDGQKKGLREAGVAEVNLGYTEAGANADANGNEHRQVGAGFVRTEEAAAKTGTRRGKVDDVWFKYT